MFSSVGEHNGLNRIDECEASNPFGYIYFGAWPDGELYCKAP